MVDFCASAEVAGSVAWALGSFLAEQAPPDSRCVY
jgi:hypothetical protein